MRIGCLSRFTGPVQLTTTRNAVGLVFALNGFLYATLLARVPDVREGLDLDNSALGLLLLAIAAGSVLALPSAGRFVERWGAAAVVRGGAVLSAIGLVCAGVGAEEAVGSVPGTALGLFTYGVGTGVWDVAMNVEGAEVERRLRRTVMPRFHAGWSLGTVAGAGMGVAATAIGVPISAHVGVLALLGLAATWPAAARFLPVAPQEGSDRPRARSAWTESRTLLVGVMALTFALAEGIANDWISLAIIDGHDTARWVGVAGFTLFVAAMTSGRLVGPVVLDRYGRVPVLWTAAAAVAVGALLTVFGGHPILIAAGVVTWGLGASLGFPVGMSAAADDPARAAARVSVVSTIGYGAFLSGPPLVGRLADRVGTLDALLVVVVLMVPAALSATAARPLRAAA